MTQYNDRPVPSEWERKQYGNIAYPRDARIRYASSSFLGYAISALVLCIMTFSCWTSEEYAGGFSWFMSIITVFFFFCAYGLFKAKKEAHKMSDIEALCSMQNDSIMRYGVDTKYANSWARVFPELAERIDPVTGNVDYKRAPADKPWEEVKSDLNAMIRKAQPKKAGLNEPEACRSKPKGRHSR